MRKAFRKLHRPKVAKYLLFCFIIFVVFLGLVYYLNRRVYLENFVIEKSQEKQLSIAKASAFAIEDFINIISNRLEALSKTSSVLDLNEEEIRAQFKLYLKSIRSPIVGGIVYVDKTGKGIIYENVNKDYFEKNTLNFSDREYFKWAKNPQNKNDVYISKPILSRTGASKGHSILVFAKPIYKNNVFSGILTSSFLIDNFINEYIPLLRTHESGTSFIADNEGYIIAGSFSTKEEVTYKKLKDLVTNTDGLLKQDSGSRILYSEDENLKIEEVVSFTKINFKNGNSWTLVVGTPRDYLIENFFKSNYLMFLIIVSEITVTATIILILVIILEKTAFKEGYLKGHNEALKDKKKS